MEFDQVVKYEFGDDVRDIDWNVTARLGEAYRKKFVEEREVTLLLVFEDTPSLQFGSGAQSKREVLLELAGLVMLLSAVNRDRSASCMRRQAVIPFANLCAAVEPSCIRRPRSWPSPRPRSRANQRRFPGIFSPARRPSTASCFGWATFRHRPPDAPARWLGRAPAALSDDGVSGG